MGLDETDYTAWRKDGGPTLYGAHKTPETADVLEAGLIFASLILAFSFFILLPGYYGRKIFYTLARVSLGVFVISSILICNFGQKWETATVHATTQYRAGIAEEIEADVGLHVGLRSINVTLKAHPEVVSFLNGTSHERINYNERFSWDNLGFTQGRSGFGPNAGLFNQEFRQAQLRGAPYPILWVAEYFTIDGEGIRWGRYYRQAGYFTHIMQWTAFPLWIIAVILLNGVMISYGGYLSILTGLTLVTANCIYAFVRNPLELNIPINSEAILILKWGWCFYLNLVTAGVCFLIGITVLIMDCVCPERLYTILDIQELHDEVFTDIEVRIVQTRPLLLRRMTTMFSARVAPIEDVHTYTGAPGNKPFQQPQLKPHSERVNGPIITDLEEDMVIPGQIS